MKSKKLYVYQQPDGSIMIMATKTAKTKSGNERFVAIGTLGTGTALSGKVSDSELGRQIRFYFCKCE